VQTRVLSTIPLPETPEVLEEVAADELLQKAFRAMDGLAPVKFESTEWHA
jgi:predicted NAD/FAD-dependent oxidoreductase